MIISIISLCIIVYLSWFFCLVKGQNFISTFLLQFLPLIGLSFLAIKNIFDIAFFLLTK